jgi:hypothetical protein
MCMLLGGLGLEVWDRGELIDVLGVEVARQLGRVLPVGEY